jgi:hypothetical protein
MSTRKGDPHVPWIFIGILSLVLLVCVAVAPSMNTRWGIGTAIESVFARVHYRGICLGHKDWYDCRKRKV